LKQEKRRTEEQQASQMRSWSGYKVERLRIGKHIITDKWLRRSASNQSYIVNVWKSRKIHAKQGLEPNQEIKQVSIKYVRGTLLTHTLKLNIKS